MKDISDTLVYKGVEYPLVFNINVLEAIQEEYGTFSAWLEKIAGEEIVEPDIKAIKFAYREMINEGIDMANEEKEEDRNPVSMKFIGRMFTEIGLDRSLEKLTSLATASNQSGESSKNA